VAEILDLYTPLNKLTVMGDGRNRFTRSWVPLVDRRRLQAYEVFHRFAQNNAASIRPNAVNMREYGDAHLLTQTTRDLVLGDTQTIRCDDDAALRWFEEWRVKERLDLKLLTLEQDTVTLGDGVAAVGWNTEKNRPVLRIHNPGFYFPFITDHGEEFPRQVIIAWESENPSGETIVTRHRWTLREVDSRALPYGGTTTVSCFYAVHDIPLKDMIIGTDIYHDRMSRTQSSRLTDVDGNTVEEVDMGIDFIPVVHLPNTPSTEEVFGESTLMHTLEALSDLHDSDSDLALGAQQAIPALATTDEVGDLEGGPGAVWGGKAGAAYVDTSKILVALQSQVDRLRDRIAETTRVSKVLLGQVQANEVPSGYALELGFHPSRNLIQEMRTVRDDKYPLILKFAYRIAQAAGILPAGPTPYAWIELGAALPADKPTAINHVKDMRAANSMSTLTAVKTLQAAGFPIEDAEAEVEAIKQEWFSQAVDLVKATGDATQALRLLGLEPTARVIQPTSSETE